METNYSSGILLSFCLAIGIPLIIFLVPIVRGKARFSILTSQQPLAIKVLTLLLAFLTIMPLLFGVAFISIFSIVNFLYQPFYSFDFMVYELSSGTLQLRLTSILVGWQVVYAIFRISYSKGAGRKKIFWVDLDTNLLSKYPEISSLNSLEGGKGFILLTQFFQFSFYILVIATLWSSLILNISSVWSQLANFTVFFILDDWVIISDYENALKGRIISGHARKILVFNMLLLALCTFSFMAGKAFIYGTIFFIVSSAILILKYVIKHLESLKNKFIRS